MALAGLGLFAFWAKPPGGVGTLPAGRAEGRISLPVATGAVVEAFCEGEAAGACAAAGVSQAAANAIANPIRFICTPDNMLEPKTQVRALGIVGSIGAAFCSLKRLVQQASRRVLKPCIPEPNGPSR